MSHIGEEVDEDTFATSVAGHRFSIQTKLFHFFHSLLFEAIFACVVLSNVICIILEANIVADGEGAPPWTMMVGYAYLSIYTVELCLRMFVFHRRFFHFGWNVFDFSLIFADYVLLFVELILGDAPSLSFLRIFRMSKLARGIKVVMMFPELALIVKGLAMSMRVVAWGAIMLSVSLIAFGVFATYVVHPVNVRVAAQGAYDGCDRCPRAFSSVSASVITLSQTIIAGDSWGQVSIPIIEESPVTGVFFAVSYSIIGLMVLNVILAVVVETASKAAMEDADVLLKNQQKEFNHCAERLRILCRTLDKDNSGSLTVKEIKRGFETDAQFHQTMALMQLGLEDCDTVFSILDKDGSGSIDYEEFIKELFKVKSHDQRTMLIYLRADVLETRRRECVGSQLGKGSIAGRPAGSGSGAGRGSPQIWPASDLLAGRTSLHLAALPPPVRSRAGPASSGPQAGFSPAAASGAGGIGPRPTPSPARQVPAPTPVLKVRIRRHFPDPRPEGPRPVRGFGRRSGCRRKAV